MSKLVEASFVDGPSSAWCHRFIAADAIGGITAAPWGHRSAVLIRTGDGTKHIDAVIPVRDVQEAEWLLSELRGALMKRAF